LACFNVETCNVAGTFHGTGRNGLDVSDGIACNASNGRNERASGESNWTALDAEVKGLLAACRT
jgi:hypothetical protein